MTAFTNFIRHVFNPSTFVIYYHLLNSILKKPFIFNSYRKFLIL